jgi:hypothetical protein
MMKNKIVTLLVLMLMITGLAACGGASQTLLPKSMKGYELYSWQESGRWRFTVITGTNRNKNLEEITSDAKKTGAYDWVNLHVAGMDEIKAVLGRIPSGEYVSWFGGQRITNPNQPVDTTLELPPANIIKEIKEFAGKCGLEFQVPGDY